MGLPLELSLFVESALRGICDQSDLVSIESTKTGEKSLCVMASCHESDLAKVIGSKGRNIGAIRTLLSAMAAKHKLKITLILRE